MLGIYRAGGPTTIFGGSGWGPYSDGPLNAVRKSYLTRDGVNEENWMYAAAERTVEATSDWTRLRQENLKLAGGIYGDVVETERGEKRGAADAPQGEGGRKRRARESDLPLGVYEPQTGLLFCEYRCFYPCVLHAYPTLRPLGHTAYTSPLGGTSSPR